MDWDAYRSRSKGHWNDPLLQVHPRIILGNANITIQLLHKYNITHIVNCAYGDVRSHSKMIEQEYIGRYAKIAAEDSLQADITEWYPVFELMMNEFLADPACKTVYIHCVCGVNRSAFLLLMYICFKFGQDMKTAATEMMKCRPCIFENTTFRRQVEDYIKKHT